MNLKDIKTGWVPAVFLLLAAGHANSHEYWLDPVDASVRTGSKMVVDVRNGENFAGAAFPYSADSFQSVILSGDNKTETYNGRLGDYPAFHKQLDQPGLYALVVNSTDRQLIYKTWEQFSNFLTYHGLDFIRSEHQRRQLPAEGVIENYRRNAKTLVQVTPGGEPQAVSPRQSLTPAYLDNAVFKAPGDEFEMVLLNNPYEATDRVSLQLLYQGKPLTDRQVELFWLGSQPIRFTEKTDSSGIVAFKLHGDGDYMLNAVHVIEPPVTEDAHWNSLWATIMFERRGFGEP